MARILFILAAVLVILLGSTVFALSSADVQNIVKGYSKEEKVVVQLGFNPVIYKENYYWFAYFTPQDSDDKNLVLIVKEFEGQGYLETNELTLRPLYEIDYDMETFGLMQNIELSSEDLKNVMEDLKSQLEAEEPLLENIKANSEADFSNIDDAISDAKTAADDSLAILQEAIELRERFKTEATTQELLPSDLTEAIRKYESGIKSAMDFSGKAAKYQKAVVEKQLEIKEQSIVSELAKLGNLKVKNALVKSYNASLTQKFKQYESRKTRKSAVVNDTISSLFFRKAKTTAEQRFNEAKQNVMIGSLLSSKNELALKDCKLSNSDLKKKWEQVTTVMDPFYNANTKEYEIVPSKISEATTLAESLNNRLQKCVNATPTPAEKPSAFDLKGAMPFVVFAIILGLIGFYLKGKMGQKQEENAE